MKRFGSILIVLTLIGALPIIIINYWVDPLQFYRKATNYPAAFYKDQRFQNPGLAKNYEYNAVLLGTSMAESYQMDEMENLFGGKFLKLTISGSSLHEQRKILEVALRTGKVEKVFWAVESHTLNIEADKVANNNFYQFPSYLYDQNPLNDFFYFFNSLVFKRSIAILSNQIYREIKNPNDIGYDRDDESKFGIEKVMEFQKDVGKRKQAEDFIGISNNQSFETGKENIDKNILEVIKRETDKSFVFIFSPPSILFHYNRFGTEDYELQLKLKEYFVRSVSQYPNARIFDFEAVEDISSNLDLYKDLVHYSPKVNSRILKDIVANKNRVDSSSIGMKIEQLNQQIENFKINKEGDGEKRE
ncbi:hypothetical protein ACFCT7_15555 [Fulvivirgaceae bacterium LMO-SS25]